VLRAQRLSRRQQSILQFSDAEIILRISEYLDEMDVLALQFVAL
jgi:hypothetical protein